ncbi:MAG: hypothetical protein II330_06460 [Clostridia bacterium]|jgi:hypothetical protein|nr:hypothetical protein [Clostridia bacterium]
MFEMVDWIALFAVVVCFFCLFCMAIAMLELVNDFISRRRKDAEAYAPAPRIKQTPPPVEEEPAPAPAPAVEAPVAEPVAAIAAEEPTPVVVAEEPVVEEPVAEEPAAEEAAAEEAAEEDENAVVFRASNDETLEDRYLALSSEEKGYYDTILFHAVGKEGSKRNRNTKYEDVKIGNTRLVRLRIKRGVIICEFTLYNTDFKNYINENKLSVKQAPTILKVTDEAAVQAAVDSIDMVVTHIAEEKEYKKQLAREKRKQARLQAAEAEENK